jgi:acetoin utilization deacetylase AcuC-like enzyme
MTLLYHDAIFLKHETGPHPETPARLQSILHQLNASGLAARCTKGEFRQAGETDILLGHSADQLQRAKVMAQAGGGYLDADTIVGEKSFEVALAAVGAAAAAVDAVLQGRDQNALCLVRPPGHHATPTTSMGFCLFNNIALAARHAFAKHQLNRILIVDLDVHHGNGTQDIFYEDPRVMFLSVHRFGGGFYPGTGAAAETGTGAGLGYTVNMPIRYGTSRQEYHSRFRAALEQAADRAQPELVLVSAGFDAHAQDPIGSLGLEVEDFTTLTRNILEIAQAHCHGRLVSCLEGGYNLNALAQSVQAHLEELVRAKSL